MQPPCDPVESMIYQCPSLAVGPHMKYIANGIQELSKKSPRSARRIAASIMKSSASSTTCMLNTIEHLINIPDPQTDKEFAALSQRYQDKPLNDEGHVPDNVDLLHPDKAFATFLQAAVEEMQAPKNINDVTDELLALNEYERNALARKVIKGDLGWKYESITLPIGCLLE